MASQSNPAANEVMTRDFDIESEKGADHSDAEDHSDLFIKEKVKAGGNESRYLVLYKAALRGDWDTARHFFENREVATTIISSRSETALHVATMSGKANDFVRKLVELISPASLALKNQHGETALHVAARVGNRDAAVILVTRNPDLLYYLNSTHRQPVHLAAAFGHKHTLEYLISVSKPEVENSPFEGLLGAALLTSIITAQFFDVATYLVYKYPNMALSRQEDDQHGLMVMSQMASVFASGERFTRFQNLIYNRIPMNQPKHAQPTCTADDFENTSFVAPANNSCTLQILTGVANVFESMIWKILDPLDMKYKKAKHQQALELVKYLCQQTLSLPQDEAWSIFRESIILATRHGISEIVEVILEMYPPAVFAEDGNGWNVMFLAVNNRFENVLNVISNISNHKYQLANAIDNGGNNLLHVCAKLPPPERLNLVPGAALQMQ